MDVPYRSFIGSYPFHFLIGPQKQTCYAHTELVAQHSSSLAALVSGPMTEAKERCVVLEDVDEDTFIRFTEYLYKMDYTAPEPDIILTSSDVALENGAENSYGDVEALAADDDGWGTVGVQKGKKKGKKGSNINRWHEVIEEIPPPAPEAPYLEDEFPRPNRKKDLVWSAFKEKAQVRNRKSWEPRQNKEACEDYTKVFLCHAQLYVFSDKYSIEPLQDLAMQKLRLTLSRFHLFEERVLDIIELLKYTYASTMEHDRGIDKLRSLVMDYVVCHMEIIVKQESFRELLQEPGALAKDLVLRLMQRLD